MIAATELGVLFRAGPLPEALPISLEVLNLAGGDPDQGETTPHKFTGGIPPKWCTLANLKELEMSNCGLDGKLLSTRAERVMCVLIIDFLR